MVRSHLRESAHSTSKLRTRSKENLPSVVLTLLSIIQALAFTAFWEKALSHLQQYPEMSFQGVVGWGQVVATFFAILIIWLMYVMEVIRFRWQPDVVDLMAPFLIGVLELSFIYNLSMDSVGLWFCCCAILQIALHFHQHRMAVRARLDEDNAEFFSLVSKATRKFHLTSVGINIVLFSIGIWFSYSEQIIWVISVVISMIIALQSRLIYSLSRGWNFSMNEQA